MDLHREQKVEPKKVYFAVFAALIALTLTTIAIARLDLGPLNVIAALTIACAKASLVVLVFMHVRHSPGLTKLTVVAGLFWLAILIALTLGDYTTRLWLPAPQGW